MNKKEIDDFFIRLEAELCLRLRASSMENKLKDVYLCDSGDHSLFWGENLQDLLDAIHEEMREIELLQLNKPTNKGE